MQVILVSNLGNRRAVEVPAPEVTIVVQMGRMSVTYQLWTIDQHMRFVFRETGSAIGFKRY